MVTHRRVFPTPSSQHANPSSIIRKNSVPEDPEEEFQKRNKKRVVLIVYVIAALLIIVLLLYIFKAYTRVKFIMQASVCDSEECIRIAASLRETMNTSIDPCEDFYGYVCGRWPEAHPSLDVSQEHNWFQEKAAKVTRTIRDLLVKNFTDQKLPWAVTEAKTLFDSCMDVESLDKLNLVPLLKLLDELSLPQIPAAITKKRSDFVKQLAKTRRVLGVDVFFGVYLIADPWDTSRNMIAFHVPTRESPFPSDEVVKKRLKQIRKKAIKFSKSRKKSDDDDSEDTITTSEKTYMMEVFKQLVSNGTTDQPICSSRGVFDILPESDIEETINKIVQLNKKFEDLEEDYNNRTSQDSDDDDDSLATNRQYVLLDDLQKITDYHVKSLNDSLDPKLSWKQFIDEVLDGMIMADQEHKILVLDIDYLKDVAYILSNTDEYLLETMIWWTVVNYAVPYSSQNLRKIWITYVEDSLGSDMDRARSIFCAENVEELMGMAAAWLFVKPTFISDGSHDKIQEMFDSIKESFSKYVDNLLWMDVQTTRLAVDKNKEMKSLIGYPEWLFNETELDSYYDGINMTDSNYFDNMVQIIRLENANSVADLDRNNDDYDSEWPMNPTEVNAAYLLQENKIVIPNAILQFPFYGLGLEALNYGAIGSILGHELTHGFDDTGMHFDSRGNLRPWWSDRAMSTYAEKTTCFIDQYSEVYLPEIEDHIDGKLTLGENIADNGGLREAYRAYQLWRNRHGPESLLPGFVNFTHDQLFFMSYAHLWCESHTSEAWSWLTHDPHCPNPVRVNMTLRNSKYFSKAWRCPKGSTMNPKKKCKLW